MREPGEVRNDYLFTKSAHDVATEPLLRFSLGKASVRRGKKILQHSNLVGALCRRPDAAVRLVLRIQCRSERVELGRNRKCARLDIECPFTNTARPVCLKPKPMIAWRKLSHCASAADSFFNPRKSTAASM